jgi:ketosteroid isomerase-like protein
MAATKAGDVDTVLSLMSDDIVFLAPAGRSCTLSILEKQRGTWALARDANLLAPVPAD